MKALAGMIFQIITDFVNLIHFNKGQYSMVMKVILMLLKNET